MASKWFDRGILALVWLVLIAILWQSVRFLTSDPLYVQYIDDLTRYWYFVFCVGIGVLAGILILVRRIMDFLRGR